MYYEEYKHLLNLPYLDGKQDCFALARNFYQELFGITLPNYARPTGFDHLGMPELITSNFRGMGFEPVPDYRLQIGDGLLFAIASKYVNHVGVYVGNNQFIHHVFEKPSSVDNLDERWKRRLTMRVRHPDITEYLEQGRKVDLLLDHLPPHLKGTVPYAV